MDERPRQRHRAGAFGAGDLDIGRRSAGVAPVRRRRASAACGNQLCRRTSLGVGADRRGGAGLRDETMTTWLLRAMVWLLVLGAPAAAAAEPSLGRIALVVGVADYGGGARLKSPVEDAEQVGIALGKLGFDADVVPD